MAKDRRIPALDRLERDVVGYAELADRVRAAPARCGGTRLVCVDGPSGSGKTVLADRLAAALGDPPVVHMDDLYAGWDGLNEGAARLSDEIVEPLANGRPAAYRRWDWAADRYAEAVELGTPDVLVVEGVGAGTTAAHASLLVWVETPAAQRFRRGMDRDGEAAYRPHWERWAAQEERHFAAAGTRDRADLVVDGAPTVQHDPATHLVRFHGRAWRPAP